MQKILRLSCANIKRHRKQTVLLGVLIMFCMAITSSAIAGMIDMSSIFTWVMDELAIHKSAIYI